MDKKLREYFQKIGRKGGLKKKLTSEQAKAMVAAREKKRKLNPHGTVILTMLLLHGATTYAGQGWYHMVPPGTGKLATDVMTEAPLREWIQVQAYDTAKACEADKAELFKNLEKKGKKDSAIYAQMIFGICVASDDPRLSK